MTAEDQHPAVCSQRSGVCDGHGCCPPSDPPPAAMPPSGQQAPGERGSGDGNGEEGELRSLDGSTSGEQSQHTGSAAADGFGAEPRLLRAVHRTARVEMQPDAAATQADAAPSGTCSGGSGEGAAGTDAGSSTAAQPPGSKFLDYIRRWSVKRCAAKILATYVWKRSCSAWRVSPILNFQTGRAQALIVLSIAESGSACPHFAARGAPCQHIEARHAHILSGCAGNRTGWQTSRRICGWSRRQNRPWCWSKACRQTGRQTVRASSLFRLVAAVCQKQHQLGSCIASSLNCLNTS